MGKAKLVENPDCPLGGIELPRFDPISIVVLESMVVVMIPLAKGK